MGLMRCLMRTHCVIHGEDHSCLLCLKAKIASLTWSRSAATVYRVAMEKTRTSQPLTIEIEVGGSPATFCPIEASAFHRHDFAHCSAISAMRSHTGCLSSMYFSKSPFTCAAMRSLASAYIAAAW